MGGDGRWAVDDKRGSRAVESAMILSANEAHGSSGDTIKETSDSLV